MSDADEQRKKRTFVRSVAGASLLDCYAKMDEMNKQFYDMFPITIETLEEPEGYVQVLLYGFENDITREQLSV